MPKLAQQLQENPAKVTQAFETIRKHSACTTHSLTSKVNPKHVVTEPSGVRLAVTGNVLRLTNPRSTWGKYFGPSLTVSCLKYNYGFQFSVDAGKPPGSYKNGS